MATSFEARLVIYAHPTAVSTKREAHPQICGLAKINTFRGGLGGPTFSCFLLMRMRGLRPQCACVSDNASKTGLSVTGPAHLAVLSPCRGLAPPAWGQRPFCLAFFSRLGRRDLFFLANFGIFVDFVLRAIWGADSPAASGTTAFFPAPLSGAFVSPAEPPAIVPFFLSAIPSSGPAEFPEIRIRG